MAIKSKARHDLTLRSIKREIAEIEALAQAYYDALDAASAPEEEEEESTE